MVGENKILAKAALAANAVLAGGGLICLSVLSYCVYYYGWTDQREFDSPVGFVFYYILPAFFASLLFASLRLPPLYKIRLAIVLISIGASAYSLETATMLINSLPSTQFEREIEKRANAAKKLGIDFDSRTELEVVADLRKQGIDAYPAPYPAGILQKQGDGNLKSKLPVGEEFLPLAGISNKTTVLCNEGLGYTIYESDERGFHNPKGLWKAGQIDIVALGDSYVHGFCVPSDKNFVALIRKHHPATLNVGIAGAGPLEMLAMVKEYVQFIKPRIVLWFHYEGNDLKDLETARNYHLLMRYLTDGNQGLLNRQGEIDRVLADYMAKEMEKSKLSRTLEELSEEFGNGGRLFRKLREVPKLSGIREAFQLVYGKMEAGEQHAYIPGDYTKEIKDLFPRVLLEAKASINRWGGKAYFVYLPQFREDWTIVKKDQEKVMNLARTLGLPVIDIHRVFQSQSDPSGLFPLRIHNHYNVEGNRLVAEKVLESIAAG